MTDHHDFADHSFGEDHGDHHDPLPFDEPAHHDDLAWHDDHSAFELPEHDVAPVEDGHDTPEVDDVTTTAHDDAGYEAPELGHDNVDVFPPVVDVGALPEPVDGFPWIDSGSLGLADIAAALHDAEAAGPVAVEPHELAEYAAADLPPGVDPWAALEGSDDPATAALAKWWQQEN